VAGLAPPVALFTGGAPGAGKTSVLKLLLDGRDFDSPDADDILDDLAGGSEDRIALLSRAHEILDERQDGSIAARRNLAVNTTAADLGFVTALRMRLEQGGHRTMMVFVVAPLDLALARNRARRWPLPDDVVRDRHLRAHDNRQALAALFAPHFTEIANDAGLGDLVTHVRPGRRMLDGLLKSDRGSKLHALCTGSAFDSGAQRV